MEQNVYFDIETMNNFMKPYCGTFDTTVLNKIISECKPSKKTLKKGLTKILKNSIYGSLEHHSQNVVNFDFASLYPKNIVDFGIDPESLNYLDEINEQNKLNETKIEYGI